MPTTTANKANRLINEKSPYLLQHAHNPVDWYPWGEEAFERAKREDKPIFLSIGYSTCHWCHVMERETFEDPAAAAKLNDSFISVKVDREERPDVDHVYMDVCQAMTGSGGWPLSIFMDADKRPFFAGTYFTNAQFIDLLARVRNMWDTRRSLLKKTSEDVMKYLHSKPAEKSAADENLPHVAYGELKRSFDARHGGFSYAPKFPSPHLLLFLMDYARAAGQPHALEMAQKTLDAMDRGGIHDHIGYGFCRYSTDSRWLVPHFEKMLYDNALLGLTYTQAFARTGNAAFGRTAVTTLEYLRRMMRSPEGGFYTAEDADSEGVEGKFYLWTREEVDALLGDRSRNYCDHYDITQKGNFEGKNIPNLIDNALTPGQMPVFAAERQKLFEAREKRVHPFLDDKILTCWNGLCMAAFAKAGRALKKTEFIDAAMDIWRFLHSKLLGKENGLMSSYREGQAKNTAHADDYAFLVWGLTELYASTFDFEYLSSAVRLNSEFMEKFWDREAGGYFYTASDAERLIARTKTVYDGATPSANSVQALNLLRLSALTGDLDMRDGAQKIFQAFAGEMSRSPASYAHMMSAIIQSRQDETRIVIVGKTQNDLKELLSCVGGMEADIVVIAQDKKIPSNLEKYFANYRPHQGRPSAYVCKGKVCMPPVTDAQALKILLEGARE